MSDTPITRFDGEFRFLSNFYPSPIRYNDLEGTVNLYPTAEHLYQALKTDNASERRQVRMAPGPGMAKRVGRKVTLRAGWDTLRLPVMRRVIALKFVQHAELAEWLMATGDRPLIEGNTWDDTFWGVCNGVGENWLGMILMETRSHLRGHAGL